MEKMTIGFIGLGLIGGSIAKAIRRVHPETNMIAFDKDKDSLITALSDGTVNQTLDRIGASFGDCQIIFLCAPVVDNIELLEELKSYLSDDCILTDVGSVKTSIHETIQQLDMERWFVGGHPMAGSERFGYKHASDRLVENAYYILTPTTQSPETHVKLLAELVESIGSISIILDYKKHDFITAAISHLPHIIAYSLVNLVKDNDKDGLMRMLAAGGFKDITRIASSSPGMWQNICMENRDNVLKTLQYYIDDLRAMFHALDTQNKSLLLDRFSEAKEFRDDIPVSKATGSIKPVYEIYIDIVDESGAIATLATILATNAINIKNIGIIHNREFQEGVLRIELYDSDSLRKAIPLLRRFHYIVHERT